MNGYERVAPHGASEFAHYAFGMKSYGGAPTLLMLPGHEQVNLTSSGKLLNVVQASGACCGEAAADRHCLNL